MRIEQHDLDGLGSRDHEVYDVTPILTPYPNYWDAVTDVPCPVAGCAQTIVWYEAGYVPGYRVCMTPAKKSGCFDGESIRHRFFARGNSVKPTLVLEDS